MSDAATLRTGAQVLAALQDLPGGSQLLELAAGREDVELVGGAVRDLLRGVVPSELDVVVEGDAAAFAGELARRLHALIGQSARERARHSSHERFCTASVWWEGHRIDVASRRSERYPEPGALPEVAPGTPEQDLRRRDFTVNAIALALGGARGGELRAVPGALEDLAAGRLRVLHGESFIEDPTRLLRLARYRARLGFAIEEHTAGLAAMAVRARALDTVSRARLGAELRLALSEPDIVGAFAAIDDLGLLQGLGAELGFDGEAIRKGLGLLAGAGGETRPDLLLLTALLVPVDFLIERPITGERRVELAHWLNDLEFTAPDREAVLKVLDDAELVTHRLAFARSPSEIHAAAWRSSLECVALVGAVATPPDSRTDTVITAAARRWLAELHDVRLRITGADLLAAGVAQGPEIGRCLQAALRAKLDGELAGEGREAELKAALEALP